MIFKIPGLKAVTTILILTIANSLYAELPNLTVDFLVSKNWGYGHPFTPDDNPYQFDHNFFSSNEIEFMEKGNAIETEIIPMDEVNSITEKYRLTYRIVDNSLIISDGDKVKYTMVLEKSPSLVYRYRLVDKEKRFEFYNLTDTFTAGEVRYCDGVKVIVERREAVVTEYLKMRDRPSLKGNNLKIYYQQGRSEGEFTSLPPGAKVTIVGRSEKKEKIYQYNSYWYLISIDFSSFHKDNLHAAYLIKRRDNNKQYYNYVVWVYGAFLK